MNNNLNIIIPFFNFNVNNKWRINNLKHSLSYLKIHKNIDISIIHGLYDNQPSLEEDIDLNNINYLKFKLPSTLWYKENLVNLGINSLLRNWEYACWIDSDIIFSNFNWVNQTINKLHYFDTVQLFKHVIYLNENSNFDLTTKEALHQPVMKGVSFTINENQKDFAASGFGWAFNRSFYEKIKKLFESSIIGGGDYIYAVLALNMQDEPLGTLSPFFGKPTSENYKQKINEYKMLFNKCKTGYIDGIISHLWHGQLKARQYEKRWDILLKHKFNPDCHLKKNKYGLLEFNEPNSELEKDIINYFVSREVTKI